MFNKYKREACCIVLNWLPLYSFFSVYISSVSLALSRETVTPTFFIKSGKPIFDSYYSF